jgi:hypothetical protein
MDRRNSADQKLSIVHVQQIVCEISNNTLTLKNLVFVGCANGIQNHFSKKYKKVKKYK